MAYTKGWAQRRAQVAGTPVGWVNATLGTSQVPTLNTQASAQAYEVTAGTSVSIRWGGALDGTLYSKNASNRITWLLDVVYETSTQGTNRWETASTDTFTENGAAGGNWNLDRTLTFTPTSSGTVRLYAQALVEVIATGSDLALHNTDAGAGFGAPAEIFPATVTALDATYGLVRCGGALSSLTPSGFTTPASQPDTVSLAFATGHAPRVAVSGETYTVSWRSSADVEFQSSTIAAGTTTTPSALTDLVDDSWPAASDAIRVRITPANSPLSTANGGSGLPWIHFTSVPSTPGTVTHNTTTQAVTFAGAFTADARLSADLHFQVDDDVFGVAKHDSTQQMLSTQSGFLWPRIRNARGEGVNGLTVSHSLDPVNPGTTISTSGATSTQDGVAGYGTRLDWTASKPGGTWNWSADITSPAASDADTHLIQSGDITTMLNTDPRVAVMIRVGPATAGNEDRHLNAGDSVKVAVCVFNRVSRVKIDPDAAPTISLVRYDAGSGWQYLSTGGSWTSWGAGALDSVTTITDPIDADCFSYTFSTGSWGNTDLVAVQVSFNVAGTPYGFYVPREFVGTANSHDGYAFDGLSMVGFGKK